VAALDPLFVTDETFESSSPGELIVAPVGVEGVAMVPGSV